MASRRRRLALTFIIVVVFAVALCSGEDSLLPDVWAAQKPAGKVVKKKRPTVKPNSKMNKRRRRSKMNKPTNETQRSGSPLAAGSWGGDHISLKVAGDSAQLEFDCAHATIVQQIKLDAGNKFDARGEYVRERGGPLRDGEKPETHPALFFGEVSGDKMTLTVKLTDTGAILPAFTLVKGAEPRINKCL